MGGYVLAKISWLDLLKNSQLLLCMISKYYFSLTNLGYFFFKWQQKRFSSKYPEKYPLMDSKKRGICVFRKLQIDAPEAHLFEYLGTCHTACWSVCVCVCKSMCACVCLCVCMCVCVCVCVCVCAHVVYGVLCMSNVVRRRTT